MTFKKNVGFQTSTQLAGLCCMDKISEKRPGEYSVCSVYSVVKQPVLKLGLTVTFVHHPKVEIKGIVMLSVGQGFSLATV